MPLRDGEQIGTDQAISRVMRKGQGLSPDTKVMRLWTRGRHHRTLKGNIIYTGGELRDWGHQEKGEMTKFVQCC